VDVTGLAALDDERYRSPLTCLNEVLLDCRYREERRNGDVILIISAGRATERESAQYWRHIDAQ
jgi:hypothetical protein